MAYKIKAWWDYIQLLLDIDGDCWLGLFTLVVVYKVAHGGLNISDAAAYGSAVGAFAYSNNKPKAS